MLFQSRILMFFVVSIVVFDSSAQTPQWIRVDAGNGPSARTGHAMVFDEQRGEVVLYGGLAEDGSDRYEDTWIWNGEFWRLAATDGPGPRWSHEMAYDNRRGKVLLFGNFDALPKDTWEWNGETWIKVFDDSHNLPSASSGHGMAFDPILQNVLLYGGFIRGYEGQEISKWTWEWTGTAWNNLGYDWPDIGTGVLLIQHRGEGVIYLFDFSNSGEVWNWDGANWQSRSTLSPGIVPVPLQRYEGIYDPSRDRIVLVGRSVDAETYSPPVETWEWDGTEWSQPEGIRPDPRNNMEIVYDSIRQEIVLFGGNVITGPWNPEGDYQSKYNDTWVYSANRESASAVSEVFANHYK